MRVFNYVTWGLLIFINVLFSYIVVDFSLNVPYYDDFDAIGAFILQNKVPGFWNRFTHLLDQYAEHRIGYTRLVSLMYFQIFGYINFKHLILWGLGGLLGIQIFVFAQVRKSSNSGLILLISSVLLLNFQYWENMMSAMTALQNLSAPFFSLGALFFLTRSTSLNNRLLAYLFVCFSVFTSGNGIILLPIGLIFILLNRESRSETLRWILFMVFIFGVYFYQYTTPPEVFGGRSNVWVALANPLALFQNFTLFMTSCFHGIGVPYLGCFALGALLVVYMSYYSYDALVSGNEKKSKWYASIFIYLLGTSCLVALNRSESLENMLFSRYKIYSTLLMLFVFLTSLELFARKWVFTVYVIWSSFFAYHSLSYISILFNHFNELRYATYSYHLNHKNWVGMYPPFTTHFTNAKNASLISQNLGEAGYFTSQLELKPTEKKAIEQQSMVQMSSPLSINNYTYHAQFIFDSNPIRVDAFNCIVMKSSDEVILVPLKFNFSTKELVKKIFGQQVVIQSFTAIIPKSNVDHGDYQLSLVKTQMDGKIENFKLMNWKIPYLANPQFHN